MPVRPTSRPTASPIPTVVPALRRIGRPLILLTLAAVAGLASLALAARWLRTQTADYRTLVVASADIALGTPLEASMLSTIAWPPGAWPEGAVADAGELVGRVTRTALMKNEPVLQAKLAASGSRGGLSAAITPGKRALTVKVNEVMGVAGFALPGSLVDVMVHTQADADRHARDSGVSKIVLERILVLAVAQDAGRDTTAPRVTGAVTLEVSPEEAERLDLARSVGTLSLVLRNPADPTPAQTAGARKPDLLALGSMGEPVATTSGVAARSSPKGANATPTTRHTAGAMQGTAAAERTRPQVMAPNQASAGDERTEVIRGTQRSQTSW